jgi:putative oxidoreductase
MSLFSHPTERQINIGLAILRTVVAVIFIAHGGQKLFVYGFEGVSGAFGQMGIPMAAIVGPFIALLEFFGGVALAAGLLTRVAALGLAFNMAGAILLVHLKAGFFLPNGSEFALALLGASALMAITGAGAFSIDALIERRRGSAAETRLSTTQRRQAA